MFPQGGRLTCTIFLDHAVFLQTTKTSPEVELDPEEVSTLHWIPLDLRESDEMLIRFSSRPRSDAFLRALVVPPITWATISISLSPRLSPRNVLIRRIIHLFVGSMQFNAIALPDTPTATAPGFVPDFTLSPEIAAGGDASWLPGAPWGRKRVEKGLRLWGLTLGMYCLPVLLPSAPRSSSRFYLSLITRTPIFRCVPPSQV